MAKKKEFFESLLDSNIDTDEKCEEQMTLFQRRMEFKRALDVNLEMFKENIMNSVHRYFSK